MRMRVITLVIALFCATSYAAESRPNPTVKKATAGCLAVLEKNFQAINDEDIEALMATTSSQTADAETMAEFRSEAEAMFEDTDVYMRVDKFQMIAFKFPYAVAYVQQLTMPKSEEDHYPSEQGKLNFRHHSGLLPEHQLVWYRQLFHFEKGKWKLHQVLTRPEPVKQADKEEKNSGTTITFGQSSCPNGQCQPFVRVR